MLFIGYPRCITSNKAEAYLKAKGISYTFRHIKENNPTAEELREWHKNSGIPLIRFFNTSGVLYKEMNLKDKLSQMSEDEMYALLARDGMLCKRPLLIGDTFVLVGFRTAEWDAKLN